MKDKKNDVIEFPKLDPNPEHWTMFRIIVRYTTGYQKGKLLSVDYVTRETRTFNELTAEKMFSEKIERFHKAAQNRNFNRHWTGDPIVIELWAERIGPKYQKLLHAVEITSEGWNDIMPKEEEVK